MKPEKQRCTWCGEDPLYVEYHDKEWGKPVHDDHKLFEFIILEGAQAGLSWITVLRKRENYRKHFANFDPMKVARFSPEKLAKIMLDPGVIRNKLKINSAVQNAKAFLKIQNEYGSFDKYLWGFVNRKPIQTHLKSHEQLRDKDLVSDALSKDLKKRGFNFVGSTICYAFMQAVGMVNDHVVNCYRYKELSIRS